MHVDGQEEEGAAVTEEESEYGSTMVMAAPGSGDGQ